MFFDYLRAAGFAAAASVLTLSGCGGDSTGTGGTSDASAGPTVRVDVSGAVTSTLTKRGSIYCSASDLGPGYTFELYVMAPPEGFNLVFDRDLAAGEHPIVGSDDDGRGARASFYYRAPDRRRFDRVDSATFVIDEMPAESGEAFVAAIDATMRDDEGPTHFPSSAPPGAASTHPRERSTARSQP